ncbi:hypothetical protein GCM10025865_17790 [Paraoerskovia sediminicola]|uniref:Uncharacterized protein n=1 Tax=Paraoerskovia sediminicola TaxID=1138587 RepID=A0ABN6XFB3_9CELL|nr:hypothetical protein GCM10025865_17790 [Paraoerskovia sediminicola]
MLARGVGPRGGEPRPGGRERDGTGVVRLVDVPQRREPAHPQGEVLEAGELERPRRVDRHGHAREDALVEVVVAAGQADRPEPAVLGEPDHGVGAVEVDLRQVGGRGGVRELWGVHPDEEDRSVELLRDAGERPREAPVEAALDLGQHREAGRHPRPGDPVEDEDTVDVGHRRDRGERVLERGESEVRRLVGRELRLQPRLRATRHGLLGEHDDRPRPFEPGVRAPSDDVPEAWSSASSGVGVVGAGGVTGPSFGVIIGRAPSTCPAPRATRRAGCP